MASKVLSTEIKDFVIDCALIINDVFRNILRTRIQPDQLQEKIHACKELKIGYFKLLPEQTAICCPHPHRVPDYDEFDVFLLYNLIRNLCPDLAPTTGWGSIPNASNEKIGDDIERLRHIRNRLYAILETPVHQTEASVESTTPPFEESLESAPHTTEEFLKSTPHSNPELISRWLELKEALQRTGKFLDTSVKNEKKIKIIEERYNFIKGEVTPKEGEVLGKERKDKIGNFDKDIILDEFRKWMCVKYKGKKLRRLYFGKADLPKENVNRDDEVIVAVIDNVEGIDKSEPFSHNDICVPIIWKGWKEYPKEMHVKLDEELSLQEEYLDELEAIEKYLEENKKNLFKKHSNLEIIRSSPFRVEGFGRENRKIIKGPCIVLYCACKGFVPVKDGNFPKKLGGFSTDVREGVFHYHCSRNEDFCGVSTDLLNPLRIGASIGKKDEHGEGSLGGFVKFRDGDKEEIGFITCAHNLYDPVEMKREQLPAEPLTVVQPSYFQEGFKECGETVRSATPQSTKTNEDKVSVDATLVRLTERHPQQLLFADLLTARMEACGFSRSSFPRSISETPLDLRNREDRKSQKFKKYIKCGTTTGLTTGGLIIGSFNDWLRDGPDDDDDVDFFNNQIQIRGDKVFSDHGDSGSFVFQVQGDELHCIGMIVGGIAGTYYSIVTPIVSILRELNASLLPQIR